MSAHVFQLVRVHGLPGQGIAANRAACTCSWEDPEEVSYEEARDRHEVHRAQEQGYGTQ